MAALIDQGQVRFEFRHRLVVQGTESRSAAEAVECAAEQSKFWPYHDKLYTSQRISGGFSKANLARFASDLNLDQQQFASCVEARKYKGRVTAQDEEAARLGVRATPTFIINGQKLEGLPQGEGLRQIVEAELKK